MPFFSVIIPTYNRYNTLKRAIDSILNQTFRDFELIVVDDGSTDKTPLIENEYGDSIRYFRQDNAGVSSSRNRGILNSNSPYLSFLDSDDLWLPQKLEEQHLFIRENTNILINQTDEIWIRNGKRVNALNKHRKREGDIFSCSLELCLISPSCVTIRRDLFDKFGLFDENLLVCEDYDLWLRITLKEKVGLITKKLVIKHGGHDDQLSKRYWGMDRFRLYSILKLLCNYDKVNSHDNFMRASESAKKKCDILLTGALKRGKHEFAGNIRNIIKLIDNNSYSKIDFENLSKTLLNPQ